MSTNFNEFIRKIKQKFPLRLLDKDIVESKYEIRNTYEVDQFKSVVENKSKYNKKLLKVFNENILNSNILISDESIYEDLTEWLIVEESEYFMNKDYLNNNDNLVTYQVPIDEKGNITEIFIKEQRELLASHGTTGFRTWEAALVFFYFVTTVNPKILKELEKSKRALELGCGTGFLGIFLSKLLVNTEFSLTDGSNMVVELCKENIQLNEVPGSKLVCEELLWGHQDDNQIPEKYDFIFGADITFDSRFIPLLVESIQDLLNDNGICLISATIRNKDTINTLYESIEKLNNTKNSLFKWKLEKIYEISDSFCETGVGITDRDDFIKKYWFEQLLAGVHIYKIYKEYSN
ncbi:hypothetical protein FOG50_02530 [Hanseniaspora uvarum]|nr:hypothetical protein FOG48_01822 [Hanseniaspora uvarum]KAF0276615.1 hypothetical protein FOG50_02530 [Hanseniaspora uvarum]